MKKYFFLLVLSVLFVGCSSDGSRELQIDECAFVPEHDSDKPEDMKKVTSIFEVVPGKYELAWKLVDDAPLMQNYAISLKLKLRLKKKVNVKQEIINTISKVEGKDFPWQTPNFGIYLLDANGKEETITVQNLNYSYKSYAEWAKTGMFNKDQTMDFLRFLQSEPGTEIDLLLNTIGTKGKDNNCVEICKNAKGIVCKVNERDKDFESKIGTIQ